MEYKKLILKEKTGLINLKGIVKILDNNFNTFYTFNKPCWFNLPPGTYYIKEGKVLQAPKPYEHKKIKLPARNVFFRPDPLNFKIIFSANPNKITTYFDKKLIDMDYFFKACYKPFFIFGIEHERGHAHYHFKDPDKTEAACDLYAAKQMLKHGFNLSQILKAQRFLINQDKVNRNINFLKGIEQCN